MRATIIALSALLIGGSLPSTGAFAALTRSPQATDPAATTAGQPADGVIRLAVGAGLGDKYMAGKTGGRYGVGGTEPRSSSQAKKPQGGTSPSTAQGTRPPPQPQ